MPYILLHPLPPPPRNPYKPDLPTFTTSSRPMAHFFHSHGWRVHHVSLSSSLSDSSPAPSHPSLCSGSPCSSRSATSISSTGYISAFTLQPQRFSATAQPECCRTTTGSSIRACGPVRELHCYLIPLSEAIFHGPRATDLQVRYLRYYAHPHIVFGDEDGGVDLCLPNRKGVALQKEAGSQCERKQRRFEVREEGGTKAGGANGRWAVGRTKKVNKPAVVQEGEDDSDEEYLRLVSAEQDEEIDEELGKQWEMCERALLASEGLRWAENGKVLEKTRGVWTKRN